MDIPGLMDNRSEEAEIERYAPTLNPEYPTGWWPVALSSDILAGETGPLRILEQDLVLWRGTDGALHCQAAHCPHLGAHMGRGGFVVDNALQCPFHGLRFDKAGSLVSNPGPGRPRQDVCLPTYRIAERYGLVFLWNGGDTPDYEVPDLYAEFGVSEEDYFPIVHRFYLPFPAKWLTENICDAMHIAFAHGAADWGESVVVEETPYRIKVRNDLYGPRKWWTWANAKRLYRRGEFFNLFTPIQGAVTSTSFGAAFHLEHIEGAGGFGNHGVGWTPVNANDSHMIAVDLVPRSRIRAMQPLWGKVVSIIARRGTYTAVAQDVSLMMFRKEKPRPDYTWFDKALVAFRRHWDSRVESLNRLEGDNIRSNGARAGLRTNKSSLAA